MSSLPQLKAGARPLKASVLRLSQKAKSQISAQAHLPALDGVRGFAILLVLLRHLTIFLEMEFSAGEAMKPFRLGWMGVDLFFVLSGFLITGILYDAKQRGGPGYFKNFYARRALRIFPVYYLALFVVLVIGLVVPSSGVWSGAHPAWQWAYLTNVVQAQGGNFPFTGHFWSLAVEEHFYLIWPVIVLLLGRNALMGVATAAIIGALLLRMTQIGGGELSEAGYVLTPMRMDALAAGSLLALLVRGGAPLRNYLKPALATAAVAAGSFALVLYVGQSSSYSDPLIGTVGLSLLCALFAAMIVLALTWRPVERLFESRALRWVGKISYGLYIWHLIVFAVVLDADIARAVFPFEGATQAAAAAVAAMAAAFAVAVASWHLWEKPFLELKTAFDGRAAQPATAWDTAPTKPRHQRQAGRRLLPGPQHVDKNADQAL